MRYATNNHPFKIFRSYNISSAIANTQMGMVLTVTAKLRICPTVLQWKHCRKYNIKMKMIVESDRQVK